MVPGIHVDVRVQLHDGDAEATTLEQPADGSSRDAFAQRRGDPAGHEDILGHDRRLPLGFFRCYRIPGPNARAKATKPSFVAGSSSRCCRLSLVVTGPSHTGSQSTVEGVIPAANFAVWQRLWDKRPTAGPNRAARGRLVSPMGRGGPWHCRDAGHRRSRETGPWHCRDAGHRRSRATGLLALSGRGAPALTGNGPLALSGHGATGTSGTRAPALTGNGAPGARGTRGTWRSRDARLPTLARPPLRSRHRLPLAPPPPARATPGRARVRRGRGGRR